MKRLAYYDLRDWLTRSADRKPMLLYGARQVGKTHLVRMLAKLMPNYVEINFEKQKEAFDIFNKDLDPKRIVRDLSLMSDQPIIPGKTLLFLDEIQQQPQAIIALRYFFEEMPDLHVIAAGSLLDFAIEQVGVPVGRITFRWIYPMSFIEFLVATGHNILAKAIISQPVDTPFNDAIHDKALSLVSHYMSIGGMPEVVSSWINNSDIRLCQELQANIITAYEKDIPKYARKHQIKYVDILFKQIPRHITKRFHYGLIESAYSKRELEPALDLLEKARLITKVIRSQGNGFPLGSQSDLDKFKLIFLDVALAQAILDMPIKDWFLHSKSTLINKGELTEAFVGQELLAYQPVSQEAKLYYWHKLEGSSQAEIDYLYGIDREVIPIEVKSGHNANLQSLRLYLKERQHCPYGIRFSVLNYSYFDKLQNYPLYAVSNIINDKSLLECLINDDTTTS